MKKKKEATEDKPSLPALSRSNSNLSIILDSNYESAMGLLASNICPHLGQRILRGINPHNLCWTNRGPRGTNRIQRGANFPQVDLCFSASGDYRGFAISSPALIFELL
jgi:hypothetical protein